MAYVDNGSQVSTLMKGFCLEFELSILPPRGLLHLKGTGDISIPFKGYIKANLIIPGFPWYNEEILFLVVLVHKYWEMGTCTIKYPGHRLFGSDYGH